MANKPFCPTKPLGVVTVSPVLYCTATQRPRTISRLITNHDALGVGWQEGQGVGGLLAPRSIEDAALGR